MKKIFVSKNKKFFFTNKITTIALFKLFMFEILSILFLKEILKKKNCILYCSFDQFFCAIGALVVVNIFNFLGIIKKFKLFLSFLFKNDK